MKTSSNRTAFIAFEPEGVSSPERRNVLAMGGATSGISGNDFSTNTKLEFAKMDLGNNDTEMPVLASMDLESPFHSLDWGTFPDSSMLPMGILAGGLGDGTVRLWDPAAILDGGGREHGTLNEMQLHNGMPTTALQFHPAKPGLIGSGGADGEVNIISCDNPRNPSVFKPTHGPNKHAGTEVTCLDWNRKVQHILATASGTNGLTVVWDLKSKKEVIGFRDPGNRTRISSLLWHPDIPTQLLVAYNDDNNPTVQFWDLRNCRYPFKETSGHTKGISCASYCPQDSSLLLTSGRDNRTVVWHMGESATAQGAPNQDQSSSMDIFAELQCTSPAFDVAWSNSSAGIVATAATSGKVTVQSVTARQHVNNVRTPPKWQKAPVGVSFGFAGKMVSFGPDSTRVRMDVVPEEPALVKEADRFENYLARGALKDYCEVKIDETSDEHEKLSWDIMACLFDEDYRQEIVSKIGIDHTEIVKAAEQYLGRPVKRDRSDNAIANQSGATQGDVVDNQQQQNQQATPMDSEQAESLFDTLARTNEESEQQAAEQGGASSAGGLLSPVADMTRSETDWTTGVEHIIKQSLLVGDLNAAVDCCMRSGKYADALLLASGGGQDLWLRTRDEYMRRQQDPFFRMVSYIMTNDMEKLVATSDLNTWQETLAILCTYANEQEFPQLCENLAQRLEKERFDIRAAVLCYMICGNFSQTVRIWASMSTPGASSQSTALQDLVEKMAVMQAAVKYEGKDSIFVSKVSRYAQMLANSGRVTAAMRYLTIIKPSSQYQQQGPQNAASDILKDRIYNSAPQGVMNQIVPTAPPFPFQPVNIQPSVQQQQRPGMMQQQQHQQQQHVAGRTPYGQRSSAPGGMYGHQQQQGYVRGPGATAGPAAGYGHSRPPMAPGAPSGASYGGAVSHGPVAASPAAAGHTPMVPPQPTGMPGTLPPGGARPGQQSPYSAAPSPAGYQPGYEGAYQQGHVAGGYPAQQQQQQQPVAGYGGPQAQSGYGTPGYAQRSPRQQQQYGMQQQSGGMSPAINGPTASGSMRGGVATPVQQPASATPMGSGSSTAPHAAAVSTTPGLPVSWPVPTSVQQSGYSNPATLSGNQAVGAHCAPSQPQAPPMAAADVSNCQRVLNQLLEINCQDGNRRKREDLTKRLNELYSKLQNGDISETAQEKVKELCAAVDGQDFHAAKRIVADLSAHEWDHNKNWGTDPSPSGSGSGGTPPPTGSFLRAAPVMINNPDRECKEMGWSLRYVDRKIHVSENRLGATGDQGYSTVLATHGASRGSWYYELTYLGEGSRHASTARMEAHIRVGWSTRMTRYDMPIGSDCFSYAMRDIDACKIVVARRIPYGRRRIFPGDTIGCHLFIRDAPKTALRADDGRPESSLWLPGLLCDPEDPPVPVISEGSAISYSLNGESLGVAFHGVVEGEYFPAVSLYGGATVEANFGPAFKCPPPEGACPCSEMFVPDDGAPPLRPAHYIPRGATAETKLAASEMILSSPKAEGVA
ncbi:protein transport protein S31 [Perkinsus olseni]|uniref:Protein transport protein S31 n=1 Tax=Perkinsus olseni TaxID=32597 RepID=A0A7J6ML27_PEROL|nr:protein transport protein S31 [Perkinsus olseni]